MVYSRGVVNAGLIRDVEERYHPHNRVNVRPMKLLGSTAEIDGSFWTALSNIGSETEQYVVNYLRRFHCCIIET